MLTNNFKQAMKLMLANTTDRASGGLEIKDLSGNTKYLTRLSQWPSSNVQLYIRTDTSNAGIHIGSGSSPEAVTDYALESVIASGFTGSYSIGERADANGNPQLELIMTITNTGSEDITVSEVGYYQNVYYANSPSGDGNTQQPIMLDRTLLNTPVTIPAGESAAITYRLKTVIV